MSNNLVKLDFGGININTPSDNFNAFYVFNHMWHHYLAGGVGLRQVCDWTMFLHSRAGKLDFTYLSQLLSEMKLMGPWQTFGCIVVNFLGLPKEEFPFYDSNFNKRSQKVLNRILKEGNFGRQTAFVRKHTRGYLYEKLFSLKCHIVRFMGMFMTFPRHSMIQIYHSITRGTLRVFADFKKKRNST